MQIKSFSLNNFTVFVDNKFDFCDGINVFIGANGTGKTHLLKAMYAIIRSHEPAGSRDLPETENFLSERDIAYFQQIFRVEVSLEELTSFKPKPVERVKGKEGDEISKIPHLSMKTDKGTLSRRFLPQSKPPEEWSNSNPNWYQMAKAMSHFPEYSSLLLPAREVLSMYEGFVPSYEKRELSFDATFYDLCKALAATRLRELGPVEKEMVDDMEKILCGKVVLKGNRFYVQSKEHKLESHLLAEGHRKLATLVHLIANGSLAKDMVLFWDEPESNLNPKLIILVARILRTLAKAGVQIFVSSHDFLLSFELSIQAEHDKEEKPVPTRFFSLSREEGNLEAPVRVQSADLLSGIQDNLILDEFSKHYDREQKLIAKSFRNLGGE